MLNQSSYFLHYLGCIPHSPFARLNGEFLFTLCVGTFAIWIAILITSRSVFRTAGSSLRAPVFSWIRMKNWNRFVISKFASSKICIRKWCCTFCTKQLFSMKWWGNLRANSPKNIDAPPVKDSSILFLKLLRQWYWRFAELLRHCDCLWCCFSPIRGFRQFWVSSFRRSV